MKTGEKNLFLTDKQIEILRMKKKGMSQADIARALKTTRGNICIIENTALKNIEKAKNTIKFYRAMEAPIWLTIPGGTDLYDIPEIIFKAADKKRIKIAMDSAMVIVKLKTEAADRIRGRLTNDDIDISVDEHGNLTIN
ncbi:DNA-binding protein, Tfx family [Methanocella conradii HZ254]|uniref:DNA-binding protein, Tfx family n=1 Tax=Methanocella conradii (strain DSM 24694 / JCM 17849 / CGMCC 1.5162 / HZ254) TaxID=1041930 RepID=H8I6P0_METCZ|nr:Tfx family DNA-binding protein [Methanocella conradii]AFC98932.1 DNA-binding protein, Tfx family [Methanocella conradii HZ254]MDI6898090.1 Tfx family DNA-binding protein [Methanocella conradii]